MPRNDAIKLTGRATAGTITALRLPRNKETGLNICCSIKSYFNI